MSSATVKETEDSISISFSRSILDPAHKRFILKGFEYFDEEDGHRYIKIDPADITRQAIYFLKDLIDGIV